MSEYHDSSRIVRLSIRVTLTSQGLSQIVLEPWPEQESPAPAASYRISVYLHGHRRHGGELTTRLEMFRKDLEAYFSGQPVDFLKYPVDWHGMTPFVRKVLDRARSIPWGEVQTYGWLSAQIRLPRSARAVGGALRRNPVPVVIPCHRILRKGGQMGGFSAGIQWKKFLLDLESPPKTLTVESIEFIESIG
ncbi:MAG: methylated-DNA--[protein]-cysteine S-methyltransferase [bacterium]